MKKGMRTIALCLVLAGLLSIGAFAAEGEPVKQGIGPITIYVSGITVAPGEGTSGTIDGITVTDAETLTLSYPGAVEGAQYMVFLLSGDSGAPTESNIAYIDQAVGTASGVSFTIFPKELKKGDYRVFLTSSNDPEVSADPHVATFTYYQAYKLGDVNDDGAIDTSDALLTLRTYVGTYTPTANERLAADVTKDNLIDTSDALMMLRYYVGNITSFE